MIRINSLSKNFRESNGDLGFGLNDISLEINKGDKISVLGRNGAGKTTFFRLLMGLISQDKGEIDISGSDNEGLNKVFGLVSNNERSFFWRLSIIENLIFFMSLSGDYKKDELLEEIEHYLSIFKISDLKHRLFMTLSSGEKKLVSIIRVLLRNPQVIMFDETTTNLDYFAKLDFINFINKQLSEKTILWATHDLEEIFLISNRYITIKNGMLTSYGEIQAHDKESTTIQILKNV